MKNNHPDGGLLLICLLMTILLAVVGGLIVSADSANPIETLMFFFRDGATSAPETEAEVLEGEDTEPIFIHPPVTLPETTAEDVTVPETTASPEVTEEPETTADTTQRLPKLRKSPILPKRRRPPKSPILLRPLPQRFPIQPKSHRATRIISRTLFSSATRERSDSIFTPASLVLHISRARR